MLTQSIFQLLYHIHELEDKMVVLQRPRLPYKSVEPLLNPSLTITIVIV